MYFYGTDLLAEACEGQHVSISLGDRYLLQAALGLTSAMTRQKLRPVLYLSLGWCMEQMMCSVSRQGSGMTRGSYCRKVFSPGMVWIYHGSWGCCQSSTGNPTGTSRDTLSGTLMLGISLCPGKLVFYQVSQFSGKTSLILWGSWYFIQSAALHCTSLYICLNTCFFLVT